MSLSCPHGQPNMCLRQEENNFSIMAVWISVFVMSLFYRVLPWSQQNAPVPGLIPCRTSELGAGLLLVLIFCACVSLGVPCLFQSSWFHVAYLKSPPTVSIRYKVLHVLLGKSGCQALGVLPSGGKVGIINSAQGMAGWINHLRNTVILSPMTGKPREYFMWHKPGLCLSSLNWSPSFSSCPLPLIFILYPTPRVILLRCFSDHDTPILKAFQ